MFTSSLLALWMRGAHLSPILEHMAKMSNKADNDAKRLELNIIFDKWYKPKTQVNTNSNALWALFFRLEDG